MCVCDGRRGLLSSPPSFRCPLSHLPAHGAAERPRDAPLLSLPVPQQTKRYQAAATAATAAPATAGGDARGGCRKRRTATPHSRPLVLQAGPAPSGGTTERVAVARARRRS
ncbi:hypothetical protein FKM82_012670 [Ascaphus truei]